MDFKKICDRITQLRPQKGSSKHKTNYSSGHSHIYASEPPAAIEKLKIFRDNDLVRIISNIRRLTMNVSNIQADNIAI